MLLKLVPYDQNKNKPGEVSSPGVGIRVGIYEEDARTIELAKQVIRC